MSIPPPRDQLASGGRASPRPEERRVVIPGVEVIRAGRVEPLLHAHPAISSASIRWAGVAVEQFRAPSGPVPRHEHIENFVHVVLSGAVKYDVSTRGKTLRFQGGPGTVFVLPRGTADEVYWAGSTHRIAAAVHPSLLAGALEESDGVRDIELTENWNTTDRHIMALLIAMTTDLEEGSPAGRLYGESLANALAVYLVGRYAVKRRAPTGFRGGLPGYRLRRVLEYIGANLGEDLTLVELAALAGMGPHYFAELFRQSVGCPPHRYVLLQRIERAKHELQDPKRSVLDAGLSAGFQNPSHFARMFRRFVGVSPSRFQSERMYRPASHGATLE